MFSFPGENVLDPFLGSGTTSLVAKSLGRNSCGYEINTEFISIIRQKLGTNDNVLFDDARIDFVKQSEVKFDFDDRIKELPYIFKDTHKLDKKIDVKKLQFGSKLDANGSAKREDFFTVKEVISPELIRLNNDLTIRLIGIKQDHSKNGSANEFLIKKTKGKKVFLKYDEVKHDEHNNLMAYLYLENKTFINAHLLKEGLALVDNSVNFKYKQKFNNLLIQGL